MANAEPGRSQGVTPSARPFCISKRRAWTGQLYLARQVSECLTRALLGRFGIIFLALGLMIGCTPRYDWREVVDTKVGLVLLAPGKPDGAIRSIRLGELPVQMTLQGVRVDQTLFTFAQVGLPVDDPAVQAQAIESMRTAMVRNLQGRQTLERALAMRVVDRSGREISRQTVLAVEVQGQMGGRPVRMLGRFAARGKQAWQWMVIGEPIDAEQAATFLDSVRLLE